MDEVELFELMSLCKSVRERVKYGVKIIRGNSIDGKAMLSKQKNEAINRYKLEVFKKWIASNTEMVENSLCHWSSKNLRELIAKAYKCCNLHRVPKKSKKEIEELPDIIEGRPAIGCSTSHPSIHHHHEDHDHHNDHQHHHESEGMTIEQSILSELQFIKLSVTNIAARIENMERRLDSGLPVHWDSLAISKNLLISLFQQVE